MVATIIPSQRLFRVVPAALVAIGFGVAVLFGARGFPPQPSGRTSKAMLMRVCALSNGTVR